MTAVHDAEHPGFDYATIPEQNRDAVRAASFKVRVYATMTASGAAQIGQQLLEVKGRIPHGTFGEWLRLEFGWSERTAQRYIAAYRYATTAPDATMSEIGTGGRVDLESFDLSAVYQMVRERIPAALANEALDLVRDGQRVARRHLDAVLARERPPTPPRRPLVHADADDDEDDDVQGAAPTTTGGPRGAGFSSPSGGGGSGASASGAVSWAWPSLAATPGESAVAAARRCPTAQRTRVARLADVWSEWLSDLAAELNDLGQAQAPRPARVA